MVETPHFSCSECSKVVQDTKPRWKLSLWSSIRCQTMAKNLLLSAILHVSLPWIFNHETTEDESLTWLQAARVQHHLPVRPPQHATAQASSSWRTKDKRIIKGSYSICTSPLDCVCALLSILLLNSCWTSSKQQPLFCWFNTMFGAHVKRTSWLHTHYEGWWSGTLLLGHTHNEAI